MNDSYLTIYAWNFIPDVPGVLDLQLRLLLGTGGRLCVHRRSEDVQVQLMGVLCAFNIRRVSLESDFIFKLSLPFC